MRSISCLNISEEELKTLLQDGITYWYGIINNERYPMFNIIKVQKFHKPILSGRYKICLILSKYSSDAILQYEHSYYSK